MIWVAVTLLALAVTLAAERLDHASLTGAAKTTASAGFVAFALHSGALQSGYGRAVLAALLLSVVGDVCLLSQSRSRFLAGLSAFGLAHVAYVGAFVGLGIRTDGWLWIAGPVGAAGFTVRHVLTPYIPSSLRRSVDAYMLLVSGMLTLALLAWRDGAPMAVPAGAFAFYLSDLSVARQRFIGRDLANRAWGLPTYYIGQLLLAHSCGALSG